MNNAKIEIVFCIMIVSCLYLPFMVFEDSYRIVIFSQYRVSIIGVLVQGVYYKGIGTGCLL